MEIWEYLMVILYPFPWILNTLTQIYPLKTKVLHVRLLIKEADTIIGKAKNWSKREWKLHGVTTFIASLLFIFLYNLRQEYSDPLELFFQFLIFFLIFGGLQVIFGSIFIKGKNH